MSYFGVPELGRFCEKRLSYFVQCRQEIFYSMNMSIPHNSYGLVLCCTIRLKYLSAVEKRRCHKAPEVLGQYIIEKQYPGTAHKRTAVPAGTAMYHTFVALLIIPVSSCRRSGRRFPFFAKFLLVIIKQKDIVSRYLILQYLGSLYIVLRLRCAALLLVFFTVCMCIIIFITESLINICCGGLLRLL